MTLLLLLRPGAGSSPVWLQATAVVTAYRTAEGMVTVYRPPTSTSEDLMASFRLTRTRGDTIRLLVEATRPDADGVSQPIDLTGATITATFKLRLNDADDAATAIQKTSGAGIEVISAADGTALVTIDPADTAGLTGKATYLGDVQLDEADGTRTTVAEGKLIVTPDVTRAGV